MIHLYSDKTPNGLRGSVMLEESGLAYQVIRIDTQRGDQHAPSFADINPARAIPVLVDDDGPGGDRLVLPQSGAILHYVAEKCGQFVPTDAGRRALMHRWFMQAATDVTSASSWIFNHAQGMPIKTSENQAWLQARLATAFRQVDWWLADHEYLADELSIADFLLYPNFAFRRASLESDGSFRHLCRWGDQMSRRPAVERGMKVFD